MPARFRSLFFVVALVACGDDAPPMDPDAGGCDDCSDGLFCNGAEQCVDGMCEAGSPPCATGTTCDEDADRCVTECDEGADADGDGVDSIDCGGDDCDDSDPDVSPNETEVCDDFGVDEDCDPTTLGGLDADEDGFVDAACCNGSRCGDDCDDANPARHPGEAETCNGIDEDCDAMIDETVIVTYTVDADRDGHGSAQSGAETVQACQAPAGFAESTDDCDDAVGSIHPGAYDRCDEAMVDDDCSGTPNDPPGGCACTTGDSRGCPLPGVCGTGTQTCTGGVWAECSILPSDEICANGVDEDCDGAADDGCVCDEDFRFCGTDVGQCGRGIQLCASDGSWGPCVGADEPNPETCNELDDDCDGDTDEGVYVVCFEDADGDGYAPATVSGTGMCASECPDGTTDRDPTDPALRDCQADDGDVHPGQVVGFRSPRTDGGGYDYDCDGVETRTATVTGGSCPQAADGSCLSPTSGYATLTDCGEASTYVACATMGGSSLWCEEVFRCTPTSGDCGDMYRTPCR
jgi:hypothetical protein